MKPEILPLFEEWSSTVNKWVIGRIRGIHPCRCTRGGRSRFWMLITLLTILGWPTLIEAADDLSPLYIVFLHVQAQGAIANGPSIDEATKHLHIHPDELGTLRAVAKAFLKQEESLRQEALQYHYAKSIRGEVSDVSVVHSYAVRRATLAREAMERLRAILAPDSFDGVQRFITSEFSKSVTTWR